MIGGLWLRALASGIALVFAYPVAVLAATAFTGVAAGDMSANDAVLWTRTADHKRLVSPLPQA